MDTLTQITLGAAVGEAVLGRRVGNRAALWGGVCGAIPDLDILASPFMEPASRLVFHRSVTHSIVFALALAPLLGGWLARKYASLKVGKKDWFWLVFLATVTHPLLDCFTAFGTALFWPFSSYRIAWNTIFVIDPLYTLPFLSCTVIALLHRPDSPRRWRWNALGLLISTLYLATTVGIKVHVNSVFSQALGNHGVEVQRIWTGPTPLNSILWRCIAEGHDAYWEGYYSLLDSQPPASFRRIEKNHHLLGSLIDHPEIQKMVFFSQGYFTVRRNNHLLYFNDLRYGEVDHWLDLSNEYIFSFRIELSGDTPERVIRITRVRPSLRISKQLLKAVWQRLQGLPSSHRAEESVSGRAQEQWRPPVAFEQKILATSRLCPVQSSRHLSRKARSPQPGNFCWIEIVQ